MTNNSNIEDLKENFFKNKSFDSQRMKTIESNDKKQSNQSNRIQRKKLIQELNVLTLNDVTSHEA